MRTPIRIAAACFLAVTGSTCAAGMIAANERWVEPGYDFSELDRVLARGVEDGLVPGVSLLLLHKGQPVYAAAFGLRDVLRRAPFTLDTVARIYSSSKWVSGAAVMAAVDDGLLMLDTTAGDSLPAYADLGIRNSSEIGSPSVRQMFSHSSGMKSDSPPVFDESITLEQAVDELVFDIDPLLAAPGTIARYGSNSMQVTGRMIEIASGESFEPWLRARLLEPLGMDDTAFNPDRDEIDRMGPVYLKLLGSWVPVQFPPQVGDLNRNPLLAAGLYSTLHDYARFLSMLRDQGRVGEQPVLSAASVLAMRTNQLGTAPFAGPVVPPPGTRYGIGCWLSALDPDGQARFVSSAGFAGTFPWYDRDTDLIGVFFIQVILTPGTDEYTKRVVGAATRAVTSSQQKLPALPLGIPAPTGTIRSE